MSSSAGEADRAMAGMTLLSTPASQNKRASLALQAGSSTKVQPPVRLGRRRAQENAGRIIPQDQPLRGAGCDVRSTAHYLPREASRVAQIFVLGRRPGRQPEGQDMV